MRWTLLALPFFALVACGKPVEADNVGADNLGGPVLAPPPMPGTAPVANEADNATAPDPQPAIAGAIPEAFRGTYDQNEESCARPSEYRLTVEAGELRFHESIGKVRSVKVLAPAKIELLADKLDQRQPWADELLGWIMLAFAAGIVLLALFEDHYDQRDMFQAAIIPAVIGVVVLAYCRLMAPRTRAIPPSS